MITQYSKTSSTRICALAALLLLGTVHNAAFAGLVAYTDRVSFLNDAATASLTTTVEGFDSDPGNPFNLTDGVNGVTLGNFNFDAQGFIYGTGGTLDVGLTNINGSVFGIGFDYTSLAGFATIFDGATESARNWNSNGFLGLLSTDGVTISSIDTLQVDGGFGAPTMDNIVIATGSTGSTTDVSEPGTLLLFALGVLGFTSARKRQLG